LDEGDGSTEPALALFFVGSIALLGNNGHELTHPVTTRPSLSVIVFLAWMVDGPTIAVTW